MSTKNEKKGFLDNLTQKISSALTPFASKLQQNKFIAALCDTMQGTMPLLIIGSFAVMLLCIDIGSYQKILASIPNATSVLGIINSTTSGAYALWTVLLLSYFYGLRIDLKQNVVTIPVSIAVFFILSNEISANSVGTQNLITSMIVGALVPAAIKYMVEHNIRIKMPNSVPKFVEEGFAVLVPAIILCTIAGVVNAIFAGTNYATFSGFIYSVLQTPLLKVTTSFWPYVLISCIASAILWPGLHANTIMGVVSPLVMANSAANLAAWQAGEEIPNIIEFEFQMIGDPGGQACLLLPCLIGLLFCKSKQIKQVSKVGFVPAIFGIGEPILFGFPCMFNALMFIPMVLTTFWNYAFEYICISTGLVGRFTGVTLPWTTPPFLKSALASTTPLQAVIMEFVMLLVNGLIWYPFVKAYDNQLVEKEAEAK